MNIHRSLLQGKIGTVVILLFLLGVYPPLLHSADLPSQTAPLPKVETVVSVDTTITTPSELQRIQELGHPCEDIGKCRLELTEDQTAALQAAGFDVEVIDHAVSISANENTAAVPGAQHGANYNDYPVPSWAPGATSCGENQSSVVVAGAPDGAYVTQVDYTINVVHPYPSDVTIALADEEWYVVLWDEYGGTTDAGVDDDPETDDDIFLQGSTHDFDYLDVNQVWSVIVLDCWSLDDGYIDSFEITIHYLPLYDPPTLTSPLGVVTTIYGNPIYEWEHISTAAAAYQLYVAPSSNALLGLINETYLPASVYCDYTSCSIDATTINPSSRLHNGSYQIWLRALNSAGHHIIDWAGPFTFTLSAPGSTVPVIGEVTNTQSTTPTINWTLPGAAANATYFHLYIAPAVDLFNPANAIDVWTIRDEVCGSWDGTICSWTLPTNLYSGIAYHVYMQSWGAGGFSLDGPFGNGWTMGMFNIGGPTPAAPNKSAFSYTVNNGQVTITFPDDPNTDSVYFYICNLNMNPVAVSLLREVEKSNMTCNGTTCTFTPVLDAPLTTGTNTVFFQPNSQGGPRGDGLSNLGWFEVGTFNVTSSSG